MTGQRSSPEQQNIEVAVLVVIPRSYSTTFGIYKGSRMLNEGV